MGKYDDIINLPHHVSETHPPMDRTVRAAQFSPFAALNGYEDAIDETARLTDARAELDEDAKELLDEKLQMIRETFDTAPRITLTYFKPDGRKQGGSYITLTGNVKKIDEFTRTIVLTDGNTIPIEDVMEIL